MRFMGSSPGDSNLTSCQPHRVTSGQSNYVINKPTSRRAGNLVGWSAVLMFVCLLYMCVCVVFCLCVVVFVVVVVFARARVCVYV